MGKCDYDLGNVGHRCCDRYQLLAAPALNYWPDEGWNDHNILVSVKIR